MVAGSKNPAPTPQQSRLTWTPPPNLSLQAQSRFEVNPCRESRRSLPQKDPADLEARPRLYRGSFGRAQTLSKRGRGGPISRRLQRPEVLFPRPPWHRFFIGVRDHRRYGHWVRKISWAERAYVCLTGDLCCRGHLLPSSPARECGR